MSMSMSMSGLKKTWGITTNTPFQVQDLLTILNIQRTPRNVTGELQPLLLENLEFPKVTKFFRQFPKKRF